MFKSSSLFRLGSLLCVLQILIALIWLWQLWSAGLDLDKLQRRLFRDHSVTIATALEPA